MSLLRDLPDTVVILTATAGTDEYGNDSEVWETASQVETVGWLQHDSEVETTEASRTASITAARLYLPAGTVIGPVNRVRVNGLLYTVEGEPRPFGSPRGTRVIRALVRRVEG